MTQQLSGEQKSVLIVEDTREMRFVLERLLRAWGFVPHVASNCREALESTKTYDIGVFDVELPDGSGVELAAELFGQKRVARVLFYTAMPAFTLPRDAHELGEVISKRSPPDELRSVLTVPCRTE